RGGPVRTAGNIAAHADGRPDGRAADPHVDGFRAGPSQLFNDLPTGRAANDRVINEYHSLAVEDLAQGVELQLDADVAQSLVRLDEGARDVAALDEALAGGDAAGLC